MENKKVLHLRSYIYLHVCTEVENRPTLAAFLAAPYEPCDSTKQQLLTINYN